MGGVHRETAFCTFRLEGQDLQALTTAFARHEHEITCGCKIDGKLPVHVQVNIKPAQMQNSGQINSDLQGKLPQLLQRAHSDKHFTVFQKPWGNAEWCLGNSPTHRDNGAAFGVQISGSQVMAVALHDYCVNIQGIKLSMQWWLHFIEAGGNLLSPEDLCGQHTTAVRVRVFPGARLLYYIHTLEPGDVYLLPTFETGYTPYHQFAPTSTSCTTSIVGSWGAAAGAVP